MAFIAKLTPQIGSQVNQLNNTLQSLNSNSFSIHQNKALGDYFFNQSATIQNQIFAANQQYTEDRLSLDLALSDAEHQNSLQKLTEELGLSTNLYGLQQQAFDTNLKNLNQTFARRQEISDLNFQSSLNNARSRQSTIRSQISLIENQNKQLDLNLQSTLKDLDLSRRTDERNLNLTSQLLSNLIQEAGVKRGGLGLERIFGEAALARTELSLSEQIAQASALAETTGANRLVDQSRTFRAHIARGEAISRGNLALARVDQQAEALDLQEKGLKLRNESQQANLIDNIGRTIEKREEAKKSTALQKEANRIRIGSFRNQLSTISKNIAIAKKTHGINKQLAKIELDFKKQGINLQRLETDFKFANTLSQAKRISKFSAMFKKIQDASKILNSNYKRNQGLFNFMLNKQNTEMKKFYSDVQYGRQVQEIFRKRQAYKKEAERLEQEQQRLLEAKETKKEIQSFGA